MIRSGPGAARLRRVSYGPVQMLFVAFEGNRFRGEIWPELERLKREGIVRILDLLVIRKDSEGAVALTEASDLGWEEAVDFGQAMGALAGFTREGIPGIEPGAMAGMADLMDGHLFDKEDAFRLEQLMPNDTTAAVALIEHVWAKPLNEAIARAQGFELLNEWVEPLQIMVAGGSFGDRPTQREVDET
jgi:uncharacterized membrane protein